jgi:hypothetical protein
MVFHQGQQANEPYRRTGDSCSGGQEPPVASFSRSLSLDCGMVTAREHELVEPLGHAQGGYLRLEDGQGQRNEPQKHQLCGPHNPHTA